MEGLEPLNKLIIANILAIVMIVGRELFNFFKDSTKDNTKAIKDLLHEISVLNSSIVKLQVEMDYIHKDTVKIGQIRREVDVNQSKIKELERRVISIEGSCPVNGCK